MSDKTNEINMRKVAIILFLVGIVLIVVHYLSLQDQQSQGDENWLINIESNHVVNTEKTIISIQPPYESRYIRLVGRNVKHPGLRIVPPLTNAIITKRAIRLRAEKPGKFHTSVEFSLQLSKTSRFHKSDGALLSTERRQFFLADSEWLQLDDPLLAAALTDIGLNETDHERLAERIFQTIHHFSNKEPGKLRNAPTILASRSGDGRERALLMVALSRKAGIPARLITGLELKDDPSASLQYWVEVYINDKWLSYHPALGFRNYLPANYVALDKYGDGVISATLGGVAVSKKEYSLNSDIGIERTADTTLSPDNSRTEWYQIFMLDRLSSDTREQLSLLMLLPLGALLSSFIRQFIGLHSYGVFTPTILALAITYAERETTMMILAITMTLVYFGRPTFHHEMARTPRLSIIFTLVATSMVIGVSILDYFSLATDGHLILLPIVIITSLVDRFFSAVEKLGNHTAFVRLAWTLILTVITLPVLQMDWLGALILRYPELHLFTLSFLILISYFPFGKYKLPGWLGILTEPEKKSRKKHKETDDE